MGAGSAGRVTCAESGAAPRQRREPKEASGATGAAADGMAMPVAGGSATSGDLVAAGDEAIPVAEGEEASGDRRAADKETLPVRGLGGGWRPGGGRRVDCLSG